MDFFKLIQSLDELVYEVLGWLLFFPRTLWMMVRRPVATMLSVQEELAEDEEHQFDDLVGPPLFLALTLTLIHIIELRVIGQDSLVTSNEGAARFITNDTNLLVLRVVIFGLLPLTVARRLLKVRGEPLNKRDLKAPFYAQCFAAAVYAILFNTGVFLFSAKIEHPFASGAGMIGAAVIWLLAVEASWFRAKLESGWIRGFWNALVVFVEWLALLLVIFVLMGR